LVGLIDKYDRARQENWLEHYNVDDTADEQPPVHVSFSSANVNVNVSQSDMETPLQINTTTTFDPSDLAGLAQRIQNIVAPVSLAPISISLSTSLTI
jgi:hypothetical protein